MWQILNILVSLADLKANPFFPLNALPAFIFWWFISRYGARFSSFFPKLTGVPWICLICQESLSSPAGDFPFRSSCSGHCAPGPSIPSPAQCGVRARQLQQQIPSIARAGFTAQSPGHWYHIMEMQLLLPWAALGCGSGIQSRYSSKIVPFSKKISSREQWHQQLSLGRRWGFFAARWKLILIRLHCPNSHLFKHKRSARLRWMSKWLKIQHTYEFSSALPLAGSGSTHLKPAQAAELAPLGRQCQMALDKY